MKVCLFGCKSTTLLLARHVKQLIGVDTLVTIDANKGAQAKVADYCDVSRWCSENGVQLHYARRYDQKDIEDVAFFKNAKFDIGFVTGWQRLIPSEILETFTVGVFGMHGSASDLPVGRGRSPINWSLIEGRKVLYTNLFKYRPGVDDGDILDTVAFSISNVDTAETLHFKNTMSMVGLISRNIPAFLSNTLTFKPQADRTPTYYPKRNPDNSLIDWSSPLDVVERFIRAVAPPFNGAFCFFEGKKITILRAAVFEYDSVPLGINKGQWGEVVEVFPNGKFLVAAPGGTLLVHEYHCEGFEPSLGMLLNSGVMQPESFPRNRHGGHDMPESC